MRRHLETLPKSANAAMDNQKRDERSWRPEFCPQCGNDATPRHTTFEQETRCYRGVTWVISCPRCGGIFDIKLRSDLSPPDGWSNIEALMLGIDKESNE